MTTVAAYRLESGRLLGIAPGGSVHVETKGDWVRLSKPGVGVVASVPAAETTITPLDGARQRLRCPSWDLDIVLGASAETDVPDQGPEAQAPPPGGSIRPLSGRGRAVVALAWVVVLVAVIASAIALTGAGSVWGGYDTDYLISAEMAIVFLLPALVAAIGLAMRRRWGAWLALVAGVVFLGLALLLQLAHAIVAYDCPYVENADELRCQPWVGTLFSAATLLPLLTVVASLIVLALSARRPEGSPGSGPASPDAHPR